MLWILAVVTFVISANLDNLTTTVMMLTMMHGVIPNRRQRMVYGGAILLSANCGGGSYRYRKSGRTGDVEYGCCHGYSLFPVASVAMSCSLAHSVVDDAAHAA